MSCSVNNQPAARLNPNCFSGWTNIIRLFQWQSQNVSGHDFAFSEILIHEILAVS
jgi:hypothetical protein